MNYKIIEHSYNKELLEKLINKTWTTFIGFQWFKMIFKEKIQSKKSTELMKWKTFLELIETLNIEDFKEFWEENHLKQVMKDLYIYWTAKNDWENKERWQSEKVFDIKARYYTFLRRAKPEKIKPNSNLWRL